MSYHFTSIIMNETLPVAQTHIASIFDYQECSFKMITNGMEWNCASIVWPKALPPKKKLPIAVVIFTATVCSC